MEYFKAEEQIIQKWTGKQSNTKAHLQSGFASFGDENIYTTSLSQPLKKEFGQEKIKLQSKEPETLGNSSKGFSTIQIDELIDKKNLLQLERQSPQPRLFQ